MLGSRRGLRKAQGSWMEGGTREDENLVKSAPGRTCPFLCWMLRTFSPGSPGPYDFG